VDVRVELDQARRVERADSAAGDRGVALVVRVLPGEHDPAALLELELRARASHAAMPSGSVSALQTRSTG
jgi:hypothetical protein